MKRLSDWLKNDTIALQQWLSEHNRHTEFFRFLIVGSTNTIVSYLVYLFFLWIIGDAIWAYNFSYLIGIVQSYFLNSRFTFRKKLTWKKFFTFPLVYVVQYIVGLLCLKSALSFGISGELAGILIALVNIPITFFMSRFLLR